MGSFVRRVSLLVACAAVAACSKDLAGAPDAEVPRPAASARSTDTTTPERDAAATPPRALEREARVALSQRLSEGEGPFFSDNLVSNETSYLHVAPLLEGRAGANGVYVGVGPEQTFSYLALVRPKLAFVIDIRRENLVLHTFYQALFALAPSRVQFLALLLGREGGERTVAETASIDDVIAEVETLPRSEAGYEASHRRVRAEASRAPSLLRAGDAAAFDAIHRAFFEKQLALSFELEQKNGRRYPRLRELLAATDLEGKKRGFLATEDAYRFVASMEREDRVVPLTGDLAGPHAVAALGAYLRERHLVVSALYVSNVEQYLFEGTKLAAWTANVAALPTDARSVIVRAYLDQGRRHPHQAPGHRTASLVQPIDAFTARGKSKPYASFWELVNEPGAAAP